MSAKKKICIFIENDFILRSYLEAFTIRKMSNEYSIELILTYRTNSNVFGEEFTFPITFIQKSQFHQFLQTVFSITYWFRKQNLSNSFATRILSLKLSRRIYYSKSKNRTFPSLSIVAGIIFAKSKVEIPQNFYSMASKKFRKFLRKRGRKRQNSGSEQRTRRKRTAAQSIHHSNGVIGNTTHVAFHTRIR